MSNYNEDDDDMFDDEADMMPQTYWTTTAEENVPAIDAVLNHRLREDTSELAQTVLLKVGADLFIGKDLDDPGRDDFEYHVSPFPFNPSPFFSSCHQDLC